MRSSSARTRSSIARVCSRMRSFCCWRSLSWAPTGSGTVRAREGTVATATAPARTTSRTAAASTQAGRQERRRGRGAGDAAGLTKAAASGGTGRKAPLRSFSSPTSSRVSS